MSITASEIVGGPNGLIVKSPITDTLYTLDTANNIIIANFGVQSSDNNNNSFFMTIYNNSSFIISVAPGTGITLFPNSNSTILPNTSNQFLIVQTSSTTLSIYLIGSSSSGTSGIVLPNNQIIVGNSLGIGTAVNMSNDATIINTGALTLSDTGVTPGTYPVANITVDSRGRISSASNIGLFYAYGPSSSINITDTTSYTTLTDLTEVHNSNTYNYNSGIVEVLFTGIYEVSYTIQFNSNGNIGSDIGNFQARLFKNSSTEVVGSIVESNMPRLAGTINRTNCTKTWIISLNQNDTVELQWAQNITNTAAQITQNECIFTIKHLQ